VYEATHSSSHKAARRHTLEQQWTLVGLLSGNALRTHREGDKHVKLYQEQAVESHRIVRRRGFHIFWTIDLHVAMRSALHACALYLQKDTLHSFLLAVELIQDSYRGWKVISMEKYNDFNGNQPRDLPACSMVPQPTALLHVRHWTAGTSANLSEVCVVVLDLPGKYGIVPLLGDISFLPSFTFHLSCYYSLFQITDNQPLM
jgi:hypothetical protein